MRLNVVEAGSGPPLLVLHGLFGAARNWGGVQRRLAERHRTLAMDLRNHGDSPHAPAMGYDEMAADVVETAAALGALPAALLGHSMGGKVAMRLALTRPETVTRLVVADIAPVTYPPRLRGYVAAMQDLKLRPGLSRREADSALAAAVPEVGVRAFLLQSLRLERDPPEWRLGLRGIEAGMPEVEGFPEVPAGTAYRGPTLFVCGEHSDYVAPEGRERALALFPAARFATVAGAGHWLHAENPAGFLGAVAPFLEEGG